MEFLSFFKAILDKKQQKTQNIQIIPIETQPNQSIPKIPSMLANMIKHSLPRQPIKPIALQINANLGSNKELKD